MCWRTDVIGIGQVMQSRAAMMLLGMNKTCRSNLDTIVPLTAQYQDLIPGVVDVVDFIEAVFGKGIIDTIALFKFGSRATLMFRDGCAELPYAVELNWNLVEGWKEMPLEVTKIFNIVDIMVSAFNDRNLGFYPEREYRDTVSKLTDLMECFGVDHQVRALCNGVPIEYLLVE